ncbi:uncharacterized protein LOC129767196 [Toxorhynchites rutilus septentrionalis]|uniref:uncharacterized protein LOC129767196 n=1 Tax=Toxorhynchites rutilus septentrionalis TaxID=329112 RepID=UPI002479D85F|nr:uncharacterized protein LOC129767196 [Toxorhynchites rutilus septentrionalis]
MIQLKRGTNGVWFWTLLLLLLLSVGPSHQWSLFDWFGGGYNGELSHFSGAVGRDDILCAKRLVGRGTRLPINIPFTTSIPIRAYLAEASDFNRNGFQVGVRSGNLDSNSVTLFIAGPRALPYYVMVDFFCTP